MAAEERPPSPVLRLCRLLLQALGLVLPRSSRAPWREGWEGELWHRWRLLAGGGRPPLTAQLDLLARSTGAFSHALWLASREWRTEPMLQDLRYAWRQLVAKPGFTAVALLSLGLGIGANSVLFSVVDGVLLHPFPYPEVDRLVALGVSYPKLGGEERFVEAVSEPELADAENGSRTLERFFAFDLGNRDLGGIDVPERLFTAFVWHDPFPTLGLPPALGRGFTREEIERQEPVTIVSHRVWKDRLGGDPAWVGRSILVNGIPRTLVGVMPARLSLLNTELWLPMWASRGELPREQRQFTVLARLADGVSLAEANAELETRAAQTEQAFVAERPEYAGWRLAATPFVGVWGKFVGPAGYILLGAVGLVLLLACTNLASLLLARASARQGELAVRAALGAARPRLVRQLLTECLLLAAGGGALGLLLAVAGLDAAVAALPLDQLPGHVEIGVNGRVLGFTLGVSLLSGLLFGVVPALIGSRVDVQARLKANAGRSPLGRRAGFVRRALVVVEVALALMLMVGAGLLMKSLLRLRAVDPGVEVENVLTMRLTLPQERYQGVAVVQFFTELAERVAAVPGVESAAVASQLPPLGVFDTRFEIEGEAPATAELLPVMDLTVASPELFRTLGIPLHRGRLFGGEDGISSPPVVVVNEMMARRYFPGREAMGRRIRLGGGSGPWATIVGVVADTRNHGLDQATEPEAFVPLAQTRGADNQLFLVVATQGDALAALGSVRAAVRSLDPHQPVYAVSTVAQRFAGQLMARQVAGIALSVFALVALGLAAMGIYGLLSHSIAERTHEIGIRMALGAGRENVLALVGRQVAVLLACGLGLGAAGALALSRSLSALLFEVKPTDLRTLVVVAAVLGATGLLAGYLPARRAAALDPSRALQEG